MDILVLNVLGKFSACSGLKFNFLIIIISIPLFVSAQLSPGPLHKKHESLEGIKNCTKCHNRAGERPKEKCLECHDYLKEKIDAGKGYHGINELTDCTDCHIEHQGRNYELVFWPQGMENFEHHTTGYVLEGAHLKVGCRKCHLEKNILNKSELRAAGVDLGNTFWGLDRNCNSCHYDIHEGQLSEDCRSCHSLDKWKPTPNFDHRTTSFPLEGRHLEVNCDKCHPREVDNMEKVIYKTSLHNTCLNCHTDIHQGRFGNDCARCHSPAGWNVQNSSEFNHTMTNFPLKGRHSEIKCSSCHKKGESLKLKDFDKCNSCHEDYHQGQFSRHESGGECSFCHTERSFVPSLITLSDHENSKFPLKGAHGAVYCRDCHREKAFPTGTTLRFVFNDMSCGGCHTNPHDLMLIDMHLEDRKLINSGSCSYCHSEVSWSVIRYDHNKSGFPLEKKHAILSCKRCHKTSETGSIIFSGLRPQCESCHEDVHNGQFKTGIDSSTDCGRCHDTQDWFAIKFDHNRDTDFALTGAHKNVTCKKCHPQSESNKTGIIRFDIPGTTCSSCHGSPK